MKITTLSHVFPLNLFHELNIDVYMVVGDVSGIYGTGPLTLGTASFGQFISISVCVL